MKKFWSYFVLSVIVIVAVFLIVSLTMASIHDRDNLIDEWKSWLPEDKQEEVVDTEENSDIETDIEVEIDDQDNTIDSETEVDLVE